MKPILTLALVFSFVSSAAGQFLAFNESSFAPVESLIDFSPFAAAMSSACDCDVCDCDVCNCGQSVKKTEPVSVQYQTRLVQECTENGCRTRRVRVQVATSERRATVSRSESHSMSRSSSRFLARFGNRTRLLRIFAAPVRWFRPRPRAR